MARGVFSGFITGAAVAALGAAGLAYVAGPPPERGAPPDSAAADRSIAAPEADTAGEPAASDRTAEPADGPEDAQGTTAARDNSAATGDAGDADAAEEGKSAEGTGDTGAAEETAGQSAQATDSAGDDARDSGAATPAETDLAAPAGSRFEAEREDRPARLPGALAPPELSADTPRAAAPAPDTTAELDGAERRAADAPATAVPAEAIAATVAPEGGAEVELGEAPLASSPGALGVQPESPAPEAAPSPPETPSPPATQASDELIALMMPDGPDAAPAAPSGDGTAGPDRADQPRGTEAPVPEQAPAAQGGAARPEAGAADPSPMPATPTDDSAPPARAEGEAPLPAPAPGAPRPPRAEAAPSAPDAAAPPEEAPESGTVGTVGQAPGDLSRLAPEVRTGRLPTADAPPPAPREDAADAEAQAETAAAGGAEPLPPIRRFAAEADLPEDAPRLAIVLIDDGSMPFGPDTLAGFPFPVSVALDPTRPGAAEAMAAYRAQGIEVLAAVDLPAGATPQDAETASAAWFDVLPETVAVIEVRTGALQQNRALAEQVAGILAEAGRGLVLHSQGLNTGLALAERQGVPAAVLFRSFGEDADDGRALQRMLDRASLRARSDGAALVAGPLRPDVVPGLVAWGLASRDAGLALAPVSAVLLGDAADD